jgi:hypothetical protein
MNDGRVGFSLRYAIGRAIRAAVEHKVGRRQRQEAGTCDHGDWKKTEIA